MTLTADLALGADLSDIRTALVRLSGRADLVVDTSGFVDNGANAFINMGQRLLDRLSGFNNPASENRQFVELAQGDNTATFDRLRSVSEVWVADATDGRTQLEYRTLNELRKNFPGVVSEMDQGRPRFWSHSVRVTAPRNIADDGSEFAADTNAADFTVTTKFIAPGIEFFLPSDGVYTLTVFGRFYSPELKSNTDVSYWSQEQPELLVEAARYEIELQQHRNTAGTNAWLTDLLARVREIFFDDVAKKAESWALTDMRVGSLGGM